MGFQEVNYCRIIQKCALDSALAISSFNFCCCLMKVLQEFRPSFLQFGEFMG
ncbi:unnamed protein product [Musa acuminata subsp. malaccensis]|uniref:(wild Malaysian banana) hypothetical protein n=1 Tax=Musa acuminata subsp. malaccensis TaxID=214687 RepID=A0A804JY58_MUSAM|nr:unnamed protein product [Musa acuminata subsp. malaccensis]